MRISFRISCGEIREKECLLVRLRCGDLYGWGEAPVDGVPFFGSETIASVVGVGLKAYAPLMRSREWKDPADLAAGLAEYRGNRHARAAFETALWDIHGKRLGKSVAELTGGTRSRVEVGGGSVGLKEDPEQVADVVAEKVEQGFRRIKIKIAPGYDVKPLEAVRSRFPDIDLMADANSAYTPDDTDHLADLDRFGMVMIEQPLPEHDLAFHAELRKRIQTPICLDESVRDLHDARQAVHLGATDILNIKVGRVGGLTEARAIHDYMAAHDVPVWIGSMLGAGVGVGMRLAAGSWPHCTWPSDFWLSTYYIETEITQQAFELKPPFFEVPYSTPGLGVEVDEPLLNRFLVQRWEA